MHRKREKQEEQEEHTDHKEQNQETTTEAYADKEEDVGQEQVEEIGDIIRALEPGQIWKIIDGMGHEVLTPLGQLNWLEAACYYNASQVVYDLLTSDRREYRDSIKDCSLCLFSACNYGYYYIMSMLIEAGANINIKLNTAKSPSDDACNYPIIDIERDGEKSARICDPTGKIHLADNQKVEGIYTVIDNQDADLLLNFTLVLGDNKMYRRLEMAKLLLDNGYDVKKYHSIKRKVFGIGPLKVIKSNSICEAAYYLQYELLFMIASRIDNLLDYKLEKLDVIDIVMKRISQILFIKINHDLDCQVDVLPGYDLLYTCRPRMSIIYKYRFGLRSQCRMILYRGYQCLHFLIDTHKEQIGEERLEKVMDGLKDIKLGIRTWRSNANK